MARLHVHARADQVRMVPDSLRMDWLIQTTERAAAGYELALLRRVKFDEWRDRDDQREELADLVLARLRGVVEKPRGLVGLADLELGVVVVNVAVKARQCFRKLPRGFRRGLDHRVSAGRPCADQVYTFLRLAGQRWEAV